MIPETTLRQIQDRLDIVEVVSAYVPLRRAGRNFKACCPFHGEKTASFMVSPDKQIFHCFGCGVGGNIFVFVMKIEKKDFPEAVEALAEKAGIEVPRDGRVDPKAEERTKQFFAANSKAAEFFHKFLLERKEAQAARAYLEKRGLGKETIVEFKLGYAPDLWDAFYSSVKGQLPDALLEKAGLVIAKKDGGGYYDRFRNRVIFPILDQKGNPVAFGGRVMDDSVPKYLNSPETEIYTKGRHLYGLFQARKAIRDEDFVVVTEGYMDLISCHQGGVENVVASLGTALTPEQARLLKRHTKNVFIVYDADKAGEAATLRGLEVLLEEGIEVKIVRLPDGEDPDSFVKKNGGDAFRQKLKEAKNLFEYKLGLLKMTHDPGQLEGKIRIANDLVGLFSRVQNEIQRSAWTKELAAQLGLSEEAIVAEMKKSRSRGAKSAEPPAAPVAGPPVKRESQQAVSAAEKMVLGLALESADFAKRLAAELGEDDFTSPLSRKIAAKVLAAAGSEGEPETSNGLTLFFRQEPEMVNLVSQVAADVEVLADKEKVFTDCLVNMKRHRIRAEREGLLSQIATAERIGDREKINEFMGHLHELNKREKKINEKEKR